VSGGVVVNLYNYIARLSTVMCNSTLLKLNYDALKLSYIKNSFSYYIHCFNYNMKTPLKLHTNYPALLGKANTVTNPLDATNYANKGFSLNKNGAEGVGEVVKGPKSYKCCIDCRGGSYYW
jgi:hypothetical protein